MRYAFVRDHRRQYPVRLLCAAVEVSRSGFYRWMREPVGRLQARRAALLERIRAVHRRSRGVYGSPRVHRALALEGDAPCRNTVAAVMKAHGLQGRTRRRRVRTTCSRPPVSSDLVGRGFRAERRDRLWTGDITYLRTGEGYLYLAAVIDLFSRRVVGWSMAAHLRQELVIDALTMAVSRRRPAPGLIFHSDRGGQYSSGGFRALLTAHHIRQSMGRRGDCYDNAPTESFWSTLKRELARTFRTRQEARAAVFNYIEIFYNRHRLHSRLGYLSPDSFEARSGG